MTIRAQLGASIAAACVLVALAIAAAVQLSPSHPAVFTLLAVAQLVWTRFALSAARPR